MKAINENILSLFAVLNSDSLASGKTPALRNMDWLAMITAINKTDMAGYFSGLFSKKEAGLKIPVADADALKRAAHHIAAHNALYESECAKLLKGLSAAGITHQEHFKSGRRRH